MTGPEQGARPRSRRPDLQNLYDSLKPSEPLRAKTITNALNDHFVLVPAGSFQMGGPIRNNELPVHEVVLTKAFYLGTHPVTQKTYQAVMGKNPSKFHTDAGGGPEHPVERVSWHDAMEFCRRLSDRREEREAGRSYRLPSEAEWEYACRASTSSAFSTGEMLPADQARFAVEGTSPVGTYPANFFGLFDMHGNVWEWCQDWYGEGYYAVGTLRDPAGPDSGTLRIQRGGSWKNQAERCRSAYRNALAEHQKNTYTGFRVVMVVAGS